MADNKTPHPSPVAPPDHSDDDLWLVSYADDDDRELTAVQIAAALERGEIDANTIVWRDGMPEWRAIAEVESLRAQLRRLSHAPENLRRRQTVLGGFGPAQPPRPFSSATPGPGAAAAPGLSLDDDEPTVIQPSVMDGFSSAPNQVRPDPSPQRGRHPTSGNTLRIKTGEPPPVTPRAPSHDRITPNDLSRHLIARSSDAQASGGLSHANLGSSPRASVPSDPDLESLPQALLVTAPNAVNVSRKSAPPPTPTRGVMSRQSDPPGTGPGSNIPRAALTRDPDSDAPPAPKRVTDAPKPPSPRASKQLPGEPESLPPDALKSDISTSGEPHPPRPRAPENKSLPSVQVRDDYAEDDLSRQRTRPPRSRREGWVESGTPPPIGELSDAAARIASATSHPPAPFVTQPPATKSSGGRWLGVAVLGIAAVAGAFALGKRSGETTPAAATHVTSGPTAPASTPAAMAPVTSVNEAPLATADVSPSAASTSVGAVENTVSKAGGAKAAVAPAKSEPKPPETNPPQTKPTAKAAPAGGTAAPAADNPGLPASTAAETAKPATATPGQFDASAAAVALGNAASRASACRQPGDPSGIARVTVTFANSGSATHALVDGPPFAGTATGGCIASTMRGATVPPFAGERVTVKKTVVIQ